MEIPLLVPIAVGSLAFLVGQMKAIDCIRIGREDLAGAWMLPATLGSAMICWAYGPTMLIETHRTVLSIGLWMTLAMSAGSIAIFAAGTIKRLRNGGGAS